jgi:hypothetical protein
LEKRLTPSWSVPLYLFFLDIILPSTHSLEIDSFGTSVRALKVQHFKTCLCFNLTKGIVAGYERTDDESVPLIRRDFSFREEKMTTIPKQSPVKVESEETMEDQLRLLVRSLQRQLRAKK